MVDKSTFTVTPLGSTLRGLLHSQGYYPGPDRRSAHPLLTPVSPLLPVSLLHLHPDRDNKKDVLIERELGQMMSEYFG